MHPDEESHLKAAFAELHRRQREQAPPCETMRERAMWQVNDRQPMRHPSPLPGWIAWGAAGVFVLATGVWWSSQLPKPGQLSSTERVDQLITAIEQHLERHEPASVLEYPTDSLLAEPQSDFSL